MNTATRILTGAALAALVTSTAGAQSAPQLRATHDAISGTVAPDSSRVSAALTSADALAESGRLNDAMHSLRTLVSAQREAGEYAGGALRRLADLQYGTGDAFQAANTLDQLADEADAFGDPTMRLRALFDAALVYQELKLYDRVPDRTRQVATLLKSPVIDQKLRANIAARMGR